MNNSDRALQLDEVSPDAATQAAKQREVSHTYNFQTIEELYASPMEEHSFVLEGMLPSSGLSIIAGKPKSGKSSLARQIAAAIVSGKPCLGRATQQGQVIYFALEEKPSEVRDCFKKLGVKDSIRTRFGAMGDKKESLTMLSEMIDAVPDVACVIIDPIFRFVGVRDANNYTEVYDAFEPLMEIARTKNVLILATHHAKKKDVEYAMDAALGSTAIAGAVDAFLSLSIDKSNNRTLGTVQRYGTNMDPTHLIWDDETLEMSLGYTKDQAAQAGAEDTKKRIRTELINYISQNGPCEGDAALSAVKGRTETKKQVFQQLKDDDFFDVHGLGVKGDPYLYSRKAMDEIRLPTATPNSDTIQ